MNYCVKSVIAQIFKLVMYVPQLHRKYITKIGMYLNGRCLIAISYHGRHLGTEQQWRCLRVTLSLDPDLACGIPRSHWLGYSAA